MQLLGVDSLVYTTGLQTQFKLLDSSFLSHWVCCALKQKMSKNKILEQMKACQICFNTTYFVLEYVYL